MDPLATEDRNSRRLSVSSMSSAGGYDTQFIPTANQGFATSMMANHTGSSMLSSRISQSRHFNTSAPSSAGMNGTSGLSGFLLNQLPSNTQNVNMYNTNNNNNSASVIDTTAATEASNTIHTSSSNKAENNDSIVITAIADENSNNNDIDDDDYIINRAVEGIEHRKDTNTSYDNDNLNNTTNDNDNDHDDTTNNDIPITNNLDINDITTSTIELNRNSKIIPQQPTLTGSTNNSISSNWLSQQHSSSLLNVTPWIEQQAQVSPNLNFHQYSNLNGLSSHSTGNNNSNDTNLATNLSMLTSSIVMSQKQQLRQPQYLKLPSNNISPPNNNDANINTNFSLNYSLFNNNYQSLQSPTNMQYKNNNNSSITVSTTNTNTNGNNKQNTADDDDLIPTAIVIKNIPFAIKKEQLLDIMSKLNLPLPYAFNYHFDNGVFRGLAFANFNSVEETAMVVSVMNGREIDGRKLRVEYKKMLPVQERERIEREKKEKRCQLEEQHRSASATSLASLYSTASAPPQSATNLNNLLRIEQPQQSNIINPLVDKSIINFPSIEEIRVPPETLNFNNPEVLEIYTRLIIFKEECKYNQLSTDLMILSSSLSNDGKNFIKQICSYLSLNEVNENGVVIIKKPENQSPVDNSLSNLNINLPLVNNNTVNAATNNNTNVPTANSNANANSNSNLMSFSPSLIRSHSHSVLTSNPGLSLNNNRYRQQSPRTVSQQYSYNNQPSGLGMNTSNGLMNNLNMSMNGLMLGMQGNANNNQGLPTLQQLQQQSQQQTNQLHHSSSTASLNLLRNKGLTAPTTPNTVRQATFSMNGGVFNNQQPSHNLGFNQAQMTGGSNISTSMSNKDDLYPNMDYLNFDQSQ